MRAVLAGARPSDDDYRSYYRAFHGDVEAATEESLRDFHDEAGRNSYERLAETLDGANSILDIGCGNGPLLARLTARNTGVRLSGIDLSEEELARARARVNEKNLDRLVVGDAEMMPFESASFDAVTSHMVLMLLPRLDPVLAEIRRVLRPGGTLAFLVPRRSDSETATSELLRAVPNWIRERHPSYQPVNPGDPKTWDLDRLLGAVRAAGFARVSHDDFVASLRADADRVWRKLAGRYYIGSLPRETRDFIRARVMEWVGEGHVDYMEPLRIITATSSQR